MLVIRHAVVGPFAENAYLVGCTDTGEALLVDPGGELDRVLALADPEGFRVKGVFLTHAHVDHAAGCAEAQRRLASAETGPLPVSLHEDDRPWLEALPRQAAMFGIEGGAVAVPEIARWHQDDERVMVGRHAARVLHTPGHTQGSCCLFFPEAEVVLTGDTLFAGSVGRTDLPGGDFDALEESIRERLFPVGDAVRFWPGHGPSGLIGQERLENPFVGEKTRRGRFV